MKIEGPSKTQGANASKKGGKVGSDGSFEDFIASAPKGAGSAAPTRSIARVDALLSVQGAESPTEHAARKRMQERGEDILKELDKLRHSLLMNNLTIGQVIDIADVVASHRERVVDPRLTAILDEIDLRAQIEMAKIQKALGVVPA
ncbi:MAG TPA: flagellar assembly protein FliX [Micavibrio sp.]|nr:flagellar assembly protein FliX [Micavibrio sp.]